MTKQGEAAFSTSPRWRYSRRYSLRLAPSKAAGAQAASFEPQAAAAWAWVVAAEFLEQFLLTHGRRDGAAAALDVRLAGVAASALAHWFDGGTIEFVKSTARKQSSSAQWQR